MFRGQSESLVERSQGEDLRPPANSTMTATSWKQLLNLGQAFSAHSHIDVTTAARSSPAPRQHHLPECEVRMLAILVCWVLEQSVMLQSLVHPVTPMPEYKRGCLPLTLSGSYVVTAGQGGTSPGAGDAYSSSHVARPLAGCASWGRYSHSQSFCCLVFKTETWIFQPSAWLWAAELTKEFRGEVLIRSYSENKRVLKEASVSVRAI